MLKHHLWFL